MFRKGINFITKLERNITFYKQNTIILNFIYLALTTDSVIFYLKCRSSVIISKREQLLALGHISVKYCILIDSINSS